MTGPRNTVARDRYVHRRVTRPDGKPSAACVRHTRDIAEVVQGLRITSDTKRVTCKLPGCSLVTPAELRPFAAECRERAR